MRIETIVVGAFILYAVFYIGRYILASLKGKKTGCGCGNGGQCKK